MWGTMDFETNKKSLIYPLLRDLCFPLYFFRVIVAFCPLSDTTEPRRDSTFDETAMWRNRSSEIAQPLQRTSACRLICFLPNATVGFFQCGCSTFLKIEQLRSGVYSSVITFLERNLL